MISWDDNPAVATVGSVDLVEDEVRGGLDLADVVTGVVAFGIALLGVVSAVDAFGTVVELVGDSEAIACDGLTLTTLDGSG